MRYYYLRDDKDDVSVLVASSLENAQRIAEHSGLMIVDLYELEPKTFKDEGFLLTDKYGYKRKQDYTTSHTFSINKHEHSLQPAMKFVCMGGKTS